MSMRYHKNEVSVCFSPLQSPRKRQEDAHISQHQLMFAHYITYKLA